MKQMPGKLIPQLTKFIGRVRRAFAISLGIGALSVVGYLYLYWVRSGPRSDPISQFFYDMELKTLDIRFLTRGRREPNQSIVIVAIDQKSEDVLGKWPFSRNNFADAVDFLSAAGARVIAFDITFPQPDENSALDALTQVKREYSALKPPTAGNRRFEEALNSRLAEADTDKKFASALSRYPNAILGYFFLMTKESAAAQDPERANAFLNYLSFQAYNPPIFAKDKTGSSKYYGKGFEGLDPPALSPNLPLFANYAKNFGFFNVIPDRDGTVRRVPVVARFRDNFYPSLDMAAALAYTNLPLNQVALIFNENGVAGIDFGNESIPTDSEGYVQVDYHGRAQDTYPQYSIADVVKHNLPPEIFRDKLVLIGPTATGIGDFAVTPFQQLDFPGVVVHANMIDNLLSGEFIRRGGNENLIDVGFILLFSLGAGALLSVVSASRATAVLAILLGFFLWLAQDLFANHRIWIAVFIPTATLFTNYAAIISYRFFFEEKEKKRVRGVFQQYLAPSLINQLLDHPELLHLGGQEKELTVMFSDIRGFTALSEGLTPSQLVELLNQYLSEMTDTIFKNWGTLDKYIGDAIMAFWGAPYPQADHAERSCRAALQMQEALKRLQAGWEAEGRPRLDMGVGINSGPVLVGNMGSSRRFNYTIMGDNVNLASRLEGLNKKLGTHLIISEFTHEKIRDKFVTRELDSIRVLGKMVPVRIYELLAPAEEAERHRDLIARFRQGLEKYRIAEWSAAVEIFDGLVRDYPQDGPSAVFLQRCQEFMAEPPRGVWDGVYVMETK